MMFKDRSDIELNAVWTAERTAVRRFLFNVVMTGARPDGAVREVDCDPLTMVDQEVDVEAADGTGSWSVEALC